ncbi:tyrosine-type recombinase/integrase [Chloroflexota bacterium]
MKLKKRPRSPLFLKDRLKQSLLDLLSIVTLERVVESFILNCQVERLSDRTIGSYQGNLGRFLWFTCEYGYPAAISDISPDHIRKFLAYVSENKQRWGSEANPARRQAGPATLEKYYKTLKAFFNWAKREGFVTTNPLDNIRPPKLPQRIIPTYNPEQIQRR